MIIKCKFCKEPLPSFFTACLCMATISSPSIAADSPKILKEIAQLHNLECRAPEPDRVNPDFNLQACRFERGEPYG